MRSECIAAMPQSLCAYAWKEEALASSNKSAGRHPESSEKRTRAIDGEPLESGHSPVSWKAHLALRDFQNLASDLAEAFFSASRVEPLGEAARPAILSSHVSLTQHGRATSRLLTAAGAPRDHAQTEPASGLSPLDLPIAA